MMNLTKAAGGAGGATCLLCTYAAPHEDVWILEFELVGGGRLYVRLCTSHLNTLKELLS